MISKFVIRTLKFNRTILEFSSLIYAIDYGSMMKYIKKPQSKKGEKVKKIRKRILRELKDSRERIPLGFYPLVQLVMKERNDEMIERVFEGYVHTWVLQHDVYDWIAHQERVRVGIIRITKNEVFVSTSYKDKTQIIRLEFGA